MLGIYFSDAVKIISCPGGKGIPVPRAYFGKGGDDSPIILPVQCDLSEGFCMGRGWIGGLIVTGTESGDPCISLANQPGAALTNAGEATLVITSLNAPGRILKLYNQQPNIALFTGMDSATKKSHVTKGAIVCFKNPGDVIRILRRHGLPGEQDRFFALSRNGKIHEAKGAAAIMEFYRRDGITAPFGICPDGEMNERDWKHI